jgi:hypothetical protein
VLSCIVPLLAAGAAPAIAQEPARPARCEARADSAAVRRDGHHGPPIRAMLVFYLAPSALLLSPDAACVWDDQRLGFWRDHVSLHASGGGAASADGVALTHSAGLELFALGGYAEFRLDRYHFSDPVHMWDARVGYLIHPAQGIAGGVTVGWREAPDVPGGWTGGGVLIGFPIMLAACGERRPCWLRWEPIYLISSKRLGFTPRFRLELPLARTPLVGRVDLDVRGMRKDDPIGVTLGFALRP